MKLALCLPGSSFTYGFVQSLADTIASLQQTGVDFQTFWQIGADIYRVRNHLMLQGQAPKATARPFNGWNYDVMLWIDSDMVWRVRDVERIISSPYDVTTGGYVPAVVTFAAWIDSPRGVHMMTHADTVDGVPFEVSGCGFGFLAIKRGVFETFSYPWISQSLGFRADFQDVLGEDASFCSRITKHGYKIMFDPRILLGHQKTVTLEAER